MTTEVRVPTLGESVTEAHRRHLVQKAGRHCCRRRDAL